MDIAQQVFAKYNDFNNTSENVTFNFSQELSKYARIALRNSFRHAYEPYSFEEEFGRTPGYYSYYRNNFDLSYSRDISKQLSLGARFGNEIYETSNEGSRDSYLNNLGLEGSYYLSSTDILLFSSDFKFREFDNVRNAALNSLSTVLRHYLTTPLYCSGWIGIDFIDSYNNEKSTEISFQASLTNDIDENSSANLSFTKQFDTKSDTVGIFGYWQFSGAFRRQVLERLSAIFSGFYGQGEYSSLGITDKFTGISAGLSYDLTRNLKANIAYSYSNTESTINSRGYKRNRIILSLSAKF